MDSSQSSSGNSGQAPQNNNNTNPAQPQSGSQPSTDQSNPSSTPPQQPTTPSTPASTPMPSTPPPLVQTQQGSSIPPQIPSAKKPIRFLLIIALLVISLGLVALWYFFTQSQKPAQLTTAPSPTVDIAPQKIIVGTDPTYPPMEYAENDVLLGYDIDLANLIGKELGAPVEFKNIVFDDLFVALESEKIDMIISTVTVTDERKVKYDFSEPYLQGGQVILTQKTNTSITSTADLRGKKVAVQRGTTIESEALKYTANELVIRYPDFVEATAALVKGDVDAIFADLPGAKGITNDNPTLKIASDPFTNEYYAVVFRKNDPQIKEINDALASLKVKGILTDLKQKWLD